MLSYQISGQGSPLLLIHGWGVTFSIWKTLAPLLSPHFKLILIELPGHGASPSTSLPYFTACADSIDELRQHLQIEQWDILGYSIGAWAGRSYYERYPQYVKRIIFLCPLFLSGWRINNLRLICWFDARFSALVNFMLGSWLIYPLIVIIGFSGNVNRYAREWMKEIQSQPVEVLKTIVHSIPLFPDRVMSIPTLYLWGQSDILASPPKCKMSNDLLINGNHSAPLMAHVEVAEKVIEFLKCDHET